MKKIMPTSHRTKDFEHALYQRVYDILIKYLVTYRKQEPVSYTDITTLQVVLRDEKQYQYVVKEVTLLVKTIDHLLYSEQLLGDLIKHSEEFIGLIQSLREEEHLLYDYLLEFVSSEIADSVIMDVVAPKPAKATPEQEFKEKARQERKAKALDKYLQTLSKEDKEKACAFLAISPEQRKLKYNANEAAILAIELSEFISTTKQKQLTKLSYAGHYLSSSILPSLIHTLVYYIARVLQPDQPIKNAIALDAYERSYQIFYCLTKPLYYGYAEAATQTATYAAMLAQAPKLLNTRFIRFIASSLGRTLDIDFDTKDYSNCLFNEKQLKFIIQNIAPAPTLLIFFEFVSIKILPLCHDVTRLMDQPHLDDKSEKPVLPGAVTSGILREAAFDVGRLCVQILYTHYLAYMVGQELCTSKKYTPAEVREMLNRFLLSPTNYQAISNFLISNVDKEFLTYEEDLTEKRTYCLSVIKTPIDEISVAPGIGYNAVNTVTKLGFKIIGLFNKIIYDVSAKAILAGDSKDFITCQSFTTAFKYENIASQLRPSRPLPLLSAEYKDYKRIIKLIPASRSGSGLATVFGINEKFAEEYRSLFIATLSTTLLREYLANRQAYKALLIVANPQISHNVDLTISHLATIMQIHQNRSFKKEPIVYFPISLDWRSRFYQHCQVSAHDIPFQRNFYSGGPAYTLKAPNVAKTLLIALAFIKKSLFNINFGTAQFYPRWQTAVEYGGKLLQEYLAVAATGETAKQRYLQDLACKDTFDKVKYVAILKAFEKELNLSKLDLSAKLTPEALTPALKTPGTFFDIAINADATNSVAQHIGGLIGDHQLLVLSNIVQGEAHAETDTFLKTTSDVYLFTQQNIRQQLLEKLEALLPYGRRKGGSIRAKEATEYYIDYILEFETGEIHWLLQEYEEEEAEKKKYLIYEKKKIALKEKARPGRRREKHGTAKVQTAKKEPQVEEEEEEKAIKDISTTPFFAFLLAVHMQNFDSIFSRDTLKKLIIPITYGQRIFNTKKQIASILKQWQAENLPRYGLLTSVLPYVLAKSLCDYLFDAYYNALPKALTKYFEIMQYIAVHTDKTNFKWETFDGNTVTIYAPQMVPKRFFTPHFALDEDKKTPSIGFSFKTVKTTKDGEVVLSHSSYKAGFAANFTHSIDASACRLTQKIMYDTYNIKMMTVHDCFIISPEYLSQLTDAYFTAWGKVREHHYHILRRMFNAASLNAANKGKPVKEIRDYLPEKPYKLDKAKRGNPLSP